MGACIKKVFFDDRWSLNQFVNNEDVRKLFIYVRPPRQLVASLQPPYDLKSKNIFFLKTNVGVKLTKENIGERTVIAFNCMSLSRYYF